MTVTLPGTDEAAAWAAQLNELIEGTANFLAYLKTLPAGTVLPDMVTASYHVPGGYKRGTELDWLEFEVGAALGVEPAEGDHGDQIARRDFSASFRATACAAHPDKTTTGYLARTAAARATGGAA